MGVGNMAVMQVSGFEKTIEKLSKMSGRIDEACIKAVEAGAGVLADEVRKRLGNDLSNSELSTGDMLESFGITPARINPKTGDIDAKVGFHGYDRKGVANKLKARIRESGSSKQRKRPFFRPSLNSTRKKIKETMENIISQEIKKMNGG